MKIDRFVKVMLVLIGLLLAFNCAKDINLSSNSGGNSSNLPNNSGTRNSPTSSNASGRNSSSSIFESSVEAATPPSFVEVGKKYRVLFGPEDVGSAMVFKVLEIQPSGWVKGEILSAFDNSPRGFNAWINLNQACFINPQD